MLAHLKIIWQFHAHPVHQKMSRFFGPRYIGDDFFLGPNLVSFNRAVVPLLELSFLTKFQKLTSAQKQKFLSVCQKRFNKLHTGSGFQWYLTYERGYETSGSPLRFMLRSSLIECQCVTRKLVFTKRRIFFSSIVCSVQPCLLKSTHFIP